MSLLLKTKMLAIVAVYIVATVVASQANALKIEASVGRTQLTDSPDKIYYQKNFGDYALHNSATNFAIGLRDTYWRAGYQYLGEFSSHCFCLADERNYNPHSASGCDAHCNDTFNWYSSGRVGGFYGEGILKLGSIYRQEISALAGLFYYRPTVQHHIPDWCFDHCNHRVDAFVHHDAQYQLTQSVGLQIGWLALTVYRNIAANGDDRPAAYGGVAYTAQIRIPIQL